jgi:hypothetical protein
MTDDEQGDTTESERTRLTDKVGVIGLDHTEYPQEDHITTVNADILTSVLTILEELGWSQVDVIAADSDEGSADYPMLVLRPPTDSIFGGSQAGICVAPKTEKGRDIRGDDE